MSLTMDGLYKEANAFKRLIGRSTDGTGNMTKMTPEEQAVIVENFKTKYGKDFYFGNVDSVNKANYVMPHNFNNEEQFVKLLQRFPKGIGVQAAEDGNLFFDQNYKGYLKKGVLASTDEKETLLHELGHVQDEKSFSNMIKEHLLSVAAPVVGTLGGLTAAFPKDTENAAVNGATGAATGVGMGLAAGLLKEHSEDVANDYVKDYLTEELGSREKAMQVFNDSKLPYYRETYRQNTIRGLKKPAVGGAVGLGIGLGINKLHANDQIKQASHTMS